MTSAICKHCIEDVHLANALEPYFAHLKCLECGEVSDEAVTVESLAKVIEPVLREYFVLGEDEKHFGEDDSEWYEQAGESLDYIIQDATKQCFPFQNELIEAVCDLDEAWPPDGDEPLWDRTSNYVSRRSSPHEVAESWDNALQEIKHSQRFFNASVRRLFETLFADLDQLHAYVDYGRRPVISELPIGLKSIGLESAHL